MTSTYLPPPNAPFARRPLDTSRYIPGSSPTSSVHQFAPGQPPYHRSHTTPFYELEQESRQPDQTHFRRANPPQPQQHHWPPPVRPDPYLTAPRLDYQPDSRRHHNNHNDQHTRHSHDSRPPRARSMDRHQPRHHSHGPRPRFHHNTFDEDDEDNDLVYDRQSRSKRRPYAHSNVSERNRERERVRERERPRSPERGHSRGRTRRALSDDPGHRPTVADSVFAFVKEVKGLVMNGDSSGSGKHHSRGKY